MTKVISKINKEASGVISYLNSSDDRIASSSSLVSIDNIGTTGLQLTDSSGEIIVLTANNIASINNIAVSYDQQQLWAELDTNVFTGGDVPPSASGDTTVIYESNANQIQTTSGSYVQNLPSVSDTFDVGIYEVVYKSTGDTNGLTIKTRILLDGNEVAISEPITIFGNAFTLDCSTIVQLNGNHTLDFQFASQSNGRITTLSNRYYRITKIA